MKQIDSERRPSRRAYASLPTLALLSVLALAVSAGAQQWTTSGNGASNISNANTGNVGVGTSAPDYGLHVEGGSVLGSIRVSGAGMAVMSFKDTSAPANQKLYQWRSQGGVSRMTLLTDSEASEALANILVANSAGAAKVGDLLVMCDMEGLAMKSEPISIGGRQMHAPGTIIGKALEKGVGDILVLLSLQ